MEPVGQPNVHVERQGACSDRSHGLLTNWDRVFPERAPEALIELHPVLPQRPLAFVGRGGESDCALHEGAVLGSEGPSARKCTVRNENTDEIPTILA